MKSHFLYAGLNVRLNVLAGMLALTLLLFPSAETFAAQGNMSAGGGAPKVIPALKEWSGASGRLRLPASGRIVLSPEDEALLRPAAEILSADLKTMFGMEYEIVCSGARRGDIVLASDLSCSRYGDESYCLSVTDAVRISGPAYPGVFWGTRTLLQMLHNQPDGLQKGHALDYPSYRWRGFMIDAGRKYFSLDYLRQYVAIMSFYKMNAFQVHLNDNGFVQFFGNDWNRTYSAFRLESDRFPGLTAKDGSYGKDEFREFQKTAARYGVEVIPEIDVPAHSLAFTHYDPTLAAGKTEYGMDHLDLYSPEVYRFLDTLFLEYAGGPDPVFSGKYVHIGTDEYNSAEAEQFRKFMAHYIDYISSLGKTPVIWGSLKYMGGETPVPTGKCIANAWSHDWLDVGTALEGDYAGVVNLCDTYLYIVPGADYYHDFLDLRLIYEDWSPESMGRGEEGMSGNPKFLGSMFAVWNDLVGNGVSQQDVHFRTFPALQVMSEKLWHGDDGSRLPFGEFIDLCRRTPEAPGVNLSAKIHGPAELFPRDSVLDLCGNSLVHTSVPEIGYPYSVEFEICPDENPASDAVLFRGPHSEFIANWNGTGKFAFRRDGYEFVFHGYRLPAGKWTAIRIEGDIAGTSLFVDGEMAERLEGRRREVWNHRYSRKDSMRIIETLIFPLGQIGAEEMGFRGCLRNISARHL